jgi:hypothetical protein
VRSELVQRTRIQKKRIEILLDIRAAAKIRLDLRVSAFYNPPVGLFHANGQLVFLYLFRVGTRETADNAFEYKY